MVSSNAESRAPAVAGRFYPGEAAQLRSVVDDYLQPKDVQAHPVRALIGPHAGLVYSGGILGETYARAQVPSSVIVMGPNHTGLGHRASVWSGGAWNLPTGPVPIDVDLRARVLAESGMLRSDAAAHQQEHAIEVHLPFLVARRPDVAIVPLVLAGRSFVECAELGEHLARVVSDAGARGREVLLVASTDMSHFHDAEEARRLDHMALDRVLALDPKGLYETVVRHRISMCGFIPTTVAMCAARALGASGTELVRYGHSGETSGDHDRVVGYAGVLVH